MTEKKCIVCGGWVGIHNKTGFCISCAVKKVWADPDKRAKLRKPKTAEAKKNMTAAQRRPELRALHSRLWSGVHNPLYGKRLRGKDSPFYGRRLSDEVKNKISEAKKGLCAGINNPFYGKHHALETRIKNSVAHLGKQTGAANNNWKGLNTVDPYGNTFTRLIKKQVRDRDGHRCRLCGKPECGRHHHVHHIYYQPKDRDINRLITLCVKCHKLVHRQKKIWPTILSDKIPHSQISP